MRTDRTRLCVRCAVRFAAAQPCCPRCGGDRVFDMTRATARREALTALRARPEEDSTGAAPGAPVLSAGTWLDIAIVAIITGPPVVFLMGAWLAKMAAVAVTTFAVLWGVGPRLRARRRLRGRSGVRRLVPLDALPPAPLSETVAVRGRVRATKLGASPLAQKPCVALPRRRRGALRRRGRRGRVPLRRRDRGRNGSSTSSPAPGSSRSTSRASRSSCVPMRAS